MKDALTFQERILAVRRGIRARQPLQQRIDLVRARHRELLRKNSRSTEPRVLAVHLDR